jgi:hypothetical protein
VSVRFDEGSTPPDAADPIHDIRPWREAGWIFTGGGAVTIERQGERTRVREARITHLREEREQREQREE